MFADEGDELLIGQTEYIVLNRYNEDGKEYLFVANILNPDENIVDNFDTEAVKLLLLSQEDLIKNTYKKEYIKENFLDTYISEDSFENIFDDNSSKLITDEEDYFIPTTYTEYNSYEEEDEEEETRRFFNVEKYLNGIEKILEVMFLK